MSISSTILKLRNDNKLSQSEFAEIFGVSQQSIQKWESGTTTPDIDKLIKISKYFGISLDALVLGKGKREMEIDVEKNIIPNVDVAGNWELYSESVMQEYYQCIQEGKDMKKYSNLFTAVANLPRSNYKTKLADVLFEIAINAPKCTDFNYNEPSDLEGIRHLCQKYDLELKKPKSDKMPDKVYGAWMGRIIGCVLGKTVECCGYDDLVNFLKATGNYPMHRYIYYSDLGKINLDDYKFDFKHSFYVDQFEDYTFPDDDTNYTVLAQLMINSCGRDFTPFDVARTWLALQTRDTHCTAEKVAYINFMNGYYPPVSAIYKNPYREWIGAQIRADYFGYINPGDPEKAAEMAFKDACISHTKNGIYGEMFVAAMLAIAASVNNIEDIILGGLSYVPVTSRLYEDVMNIYNGYKSGRSQNDTFKYIHKKYDSTESGGWVHTNPSAMVVVTSLLYGKGDYGKSICMAVDNGFDTDCNAATVGSIIGMIIGYDRIPDYWKKPIKNEMHADIYLHEIVDIKKCAEETVKHFA